MNIKIPWNNDDISSLHSINRTLVYDVNGQANFKSERARTSVGEKRKGVERKIGKNEKKER